MPTEFVTLGDSFMTALLDPDVDKRRTGVEAWLNSAIPVLQAAVADESRTFVRKLIEASLTLEGWNALERDSRQNSYGLAMEVKLVSTGSRNLSYTPSAPKGGNAGAAEPAGYSDGDDGSAKGRSSNDDRSDSMNPNNPGYQAALDNLSNQMNPNNPAYHSSRGGETR